MKTRAKLKQEITANEKKILTLQKKNIALERQSFLLSDKKQWFTEENETHGKGKKKETLLVGRINWKDDFKVDDTNEVITIERSEVVRINGIWQPTINL